MVAAGTAASGAKERSEPFDLELELRALIRARVGAAVSQPTAGRKAGGLREVGISHGLLRPPVKEIESKARPSFCAALSFGPNQSPLYEKSTCGGEDSNAPPFGSRTSDAASTVGRKEGGIFESPTPHSQGGRREVRISHAPPAHCPRPQRRPRRPVSPNTARTAL
jgi:hypothetical protein